MDIKKILIITGAALLVFFLVTQPVQSAGIVNSILTSLREGAEAVITFVRTVFQG
ncbi:MULTISPECIES: hypothetical protein [Actinokineospora]|uniref:Uncharacterized protein n=1 Tax=Actinokineospora globicatena TaxID=103729 RepID=A0A9W6QN48_9PSEU|nr:MULTISPECIES: hypothetical protein [Actinokineospora]MBM7772093.1 hypothetical protein [Actinokineospora baliensis]MCP2300414.1 hypothetical protein [Actinokineospora globicatena]GLW80947.1 hypothetical protein Aglo01_54280 [Actinokineospora globicatena]GLW88140.1 hypothetical protein Aglo02_57790 [Actinokineospora globicatena]GLW92622.1 hypothetical protein Aglo03_34380 [Actinokineospora globicatena]